MTWNTSNCCCADGAENTDEQTLSTTEVGGVTTEITIENGNTIAVNHPASQTLSTTEVGGVTTAITISDGNTVAINHPATSPTSVNVTEVLRTTMEIGANGNINNTAAPNDIDNLSIGLDEIGMSLSGNDEFVLPAGNYEIYASVNFDMSGGQPRTNFNLLLREGTTVIQSANGHNYMRNANDHDEASQSTTFYLETTGGTFNLATQREASAGVTQLTDGWVIVRRFEQKAVLVSL